MDLTEFLNEINNHRKSGGWYSGNYIVDNKSVQIKGYGTWLQFYRVDNVDYSNNMERKVSEFLQDLNIPFNKGVIENETQTYSK